MITCPVVTLLPIRFLAGLAQKSRIVVEQPLMKGLQLPSSAVAYNVFRSPSDKEKDACSLQQKLENSSQLPLS